MKYQSFVFKFLLLLFLSQLASCDLQKDNCEVSCDDPNRYEIYENLPIDKQFDFYRNCACWTDSITDTGVLRETLLRREDIVGFLVKTLENEQDSERLVDALELLSYVGNRKYNIHSKDLRGRQDINSLVDETVKRIPEKDERDLWDKIYWKDKKSRKERLGKLAEEIKAQTENVYEVEIKNEEGKSNEEK